MILFFTIHLRNYSGLSMQLVTWARRKLPDAYSGFYLWWTAGDGSDFPLEIAMDKRSCTILLLMDFIRD